MNILIPVAAVAVILTACGSKTENTAIQHEETVEHGCAVHSHEMMIAGVAQADDSVANHITVVKLHDGTVRIFDYSSSNPDKIAAWQAGDTVTVFLHHNHGEEAHDSVTAIKIGNFECRHHEHDASCDRHDHEAHEHNHEHHHAH